MKSGDLHKLSDRDLLAALKTFNDGVTGNEANYGLTAAQTADLGTLISGFETNVDALDAARAAEDSAQGGRDDARDDLVTAVRKTINLVRANDVSKDLLGKAGLDEYDDTKTASPAPTSAPFAMIDYGKLRHKIAFRDANTPNSEAKPDGMLGAEIWRYIGDTPPESYKSYEFVTLDTASPYDCYYDASDANKKVYYILRWKSKNGELGEWSETVEATVNG